MASAAEFSSGKTVLILSLVIGCFAVLWPKIFYPMLQASISSTANLPYSEVSGVYRSSVLPCCHPVTFTKELNALYFTELCNRLKWRAGRRSEPLLLPPEQRHDVWTPGVSRWCRDEVARTCGVRLDEPTLERYRRAAHRRDQDDAATRNLTRCLEASYDLRWEEIRPTLLQRQTGSKYPHQERPAAGHPSNREPMPHAAAAAAHAQVQNMARQPRRPVDRMARPPGPQPGMRPGLGGGFVQPPTKGSGAMGIIMPIYTVGIVIFFMYTIMRVMFKKQPDKESRARELKAAAMYAGYRLRPDVADGSPARTEPAVERRAAAPATAAAPTAPTPGAADGAAAADETTAASREPAVPPRQEEAEIDQLRRRLEETERAMERIMKQMSSVSHKLNAAKISSNIRALKQELWGSVDSLASDSLASDYSLSLDSRAQVLTDPSLWTYSLETGAGSASAPRALSRDEAGSMATAVSRLARSVSQLSLELETAPADDEASLPLETGAELSELADAEEAADVVDGVDELRHDGANAVRRFASLEALLSRGAGAGQTAAAGEAEAEAAAEVGPGTAAGRGDAAEARWAGDGGPETGAGRPAAPVAPSASSDGRAASGPGLPAAVAPASELSGGPARACGPSDGPAPPSCPVEPCLVAADAAGSVVSDPRSGPSDPRSGPSDPRSGQSGPRSSGSGRSASSPGSDTPSTPRVIVLGLRTKRTPEPEPRSVTFRLGGDDGQVLASCRLDADRLPPESAVMIRETETRAGRADAALQTKLELEIAGMEATAAPPRAAWTARLQQATETTLASIEDDLDKAAKALNKVTAKEAKDSNGVDTDEVPPARDGAAADVSGVQRIQEVQEP